MKFSQIKDKKYLADIGTKFVETEKLVPYAMNSRTHSVEQISKIAASIKEFKFLNPIIIDGDKGIIAGHGRVSAANKLEMQFVPVVDGSHLSEAQKKAYVIADNKLTTLGAWDEDLLKAEMEALQKIEFDLDLTGFEMSEIEDLFKSLDLPDLSDKNKEIDVDSFGDDLDQTCPKCGFEFRG